MPAAGPAPAGVMERGLGVAWRAYRPTGAEREAGGPERARCRALGPGNFNLAMSPRRPPSLGHHACQLSAPSEAFRSCAYCSATWAHSSTARAHSSTRRASPYAMVGADRPENGTDVTASMRATRCATRRVARAAGPNFNWAGSRAANFNKAGTPAPAGRPSRRHPPTLVSSGHHGGPRRARTREGGGTSTPPSSLQPGGISSQNDRGRPASARRPTGARLVPLERQVTGLQC